MRWLEYSFAWVSEEYGLDYYDHFMSQTYAAKYASFIPMMASLSTDEMVATAAVIWNYHVTDFSISEDENNVYFHLDPCGSGGRLYRNEMHLDSFAYGTELAPLTSEKHPIGFNREGLGFYCTHCASGNRVQMQNPASPLFAIFDGEAQGKPGMPCRMTIVKNEAPRQLDERLLRQLGMETLVAPDEVG